MKLRAGHWLVIGLMSCVKRMVAVKKTVWDRLADGRRSASSAGTRETDTQPLALSPPSTLALSSQHILFHSHSFLKSVLGTSSCNLFFLYLLFRTTPMRFHPLDVLCLIHAVHAVSFPFEVHHTPSRRSTGSSLEKRSNLPIKNIANSVYVSNITLGGQTVPVMLDTGR